MKNTMQNMVNIIQDLSDYELMQLHNDWARDNGWNNLVINDMRYLDLSDYKMDDQDYFKGRNFSENDRFYNWDGLASDAQLRSAYSARSLTKDQVTLAEYARDVNYFNLDD